MTYHPGSTILVGVDGSPDACIAAAWAVDVGRRMNASVKAIAAWSDVPPPYDDALYDHAAEIDAHVANVAAQSLQRDGIEDIEVTAAQGPIAKTLLEAADASNASMLVVGTRGLGPLSGLLLGSISRRLLFTTHVPLTVVPHRSALEPERLTRVLVGVDCSGVARRVLSWAASFCAAVGVPATIARCADPGCERPPGYVEGFDGRTRSDIDQELKPLRDLDVEYTVAVAHCDPRVALPETATRDQAGLIVIGTSGAGRFRGLGGTASYLARHSPVPIAVVP